ncbi:MAG: hypothetical protein UHD64_10100 [Bacteroidales bacterium]|nr:hypothetical protein [Bacteroidales bacterium]
MSRAINITGQKFGRLTAIKPCGKTNAGNVLWLCKCDCGKETTVPTQHLRSGNTKSCGCFNSEVASRTFTKTGHSNSRLYRIWRNMKRRCNDKNFKAYKNYGEKGIKICFEWLEFENFYNWAIFNGYRDDLTIDRINVNGDYEPNNCQWITRSENTKKSWRDRNVKR